MMANVKDLPEYRIVDQDLLKTTSKSELDDLEFALKSFAEKRDIVVPFLTPEEISKMEALDLHKLFDYTAMLAAGKEATYIRKEYRVFLIQLTYQLGVLFKERFPNESMGDLLLTRMGKLSTKDLQFETKALDHCLKEAFKELKIPLVNTEASNRIYPWNPAVIELFLTDLVNLGKWFADNLERKKN